MCTKLLKSEIFQQQVTFTEPPHLKNKSESSPDLASLTSSSSKATTDEKYVINQLTRRKSESNIAKRESRTITLPEEFVNKMYQTMEGLCVKSFSENS